MKIHNPKSFMKQKRTWIIAALAVLVVACIGISIASGARYARVTNTVNQAYDEAKASAKQILVGSKASRGERLAAIKNLSETQVRADCKGEWWNSWYGAVVPSAKAQVEDCITKLKRLGVISSAANTFNEYLEDDTKVAKTLAVLKIARGTDNWQKAALSSADSVLKDIEAMSVTKDNKPLLAASKEKVLAIINSWNALSVASSKEDKTAYLDAESKLIQSYADLGAISDVSDERIETLLAVLQAQAHKL